MSYIIGIDLGTTNCTMTYTSCEGNEKGSIHQLPIYQRISQGSEGQALSLPSFYYFPLSEEGEEPLVGVYAKERGHELPQRMIGSAKSWICHDGISRRSSFLPLGDFTPKKSPLDVLAKLLEVMRTTWEKEFPGHRFANQHVLVTVPASFDPSARELIQEATLLAEYPEVVLMEEPLAAFYAWLNRHQDHWRELLHVGDTVLVVDIGGGTTDFSLISVEEKEGDLVLERKAVGNHLLLGGDNIDLALAHFCKSKLNTSMSDWQFQSLIATCRKAKETLLGEEGAAQVEITVHGQGSSLIASTLTTTLSKDEIIHLLVEGFFPEVSLDEKVHQRKKSGITELGLPFVHDPRVTTHLASFLHQSQCPFPTAILFNGGTMKAFAFRERIVSLLNQWGGQPVRELPETDLDFAVSQGAAYYGLARSGEGIRVRAGTSHSYFIGIEGASPAIPGVPPPLKALCIAPFGMEEGSEVSWDEEEFTLVLDEPATFRFFCRNTPTLTNGEVAKAGTVVTKWNEELQELHTIETLLESGKDAGKSVQITLKAKVTELGMLELWCVAQDGRKWKLEFDIR